MVGGSEDRTCCCRRVSGRRAFLLHLLLPIHKVRLGATTIRQFLGSCSISDDNNG